MHFSQASVLAALVAAVSALQITSPGLNAQVDLSKKTTITWSSVSTDPTSFSIVLVNQNVSPSVSINIADNVETSAGSYDVPPQDVSTGGNYQFNLISKEANNEGILAQSQQFTVTAAGTASASSSAAASASSAATSASSAVSSVKSSASSAASSSAAAASSSGSAAASSAAASGSSAVASASAARSSDNAAAGYHIASGAAGLGFVGAIIALFA